MSLQNDTRYANIEDTTWWLLGSNEAFWNATIYNLFKRKKFCWPQIFLPNAYLPEIRESSADGTEAKILGQGASR